MLMKLKSLLLTGALLLSCGVYAEVAERQKPAFEGQPIEAFTDGTTSMYMYNVGAKKFFAAGNAWGTQTSVSDQGYRVYFEQFVIDAAAGWDGTTVLFRDSCLAKSGNKMDVFFDNQGGGCFVDRGSQGNLYWKLEKNADNAYYRLSMAENNPNYEAWQVAADSLGRTYFGWSDEYGTVVNAFTPATDTTSVDWGFYTIADYDAYQAKLTVYNAAQALFPFLQDAWAKGVDVAAQEAVYANLEATTDELAAALDEVKAALAVYEEENVVPSNPVDKTSLIQSPNFDGDKKDGWKGTSPAMGYSTAEFYEKSFDAYQTITGAPKGVYAVSVQSYLRAGWAGDDSYSKYIDNYKNHDAWIYAANGVDSVNVQVPSIYVGATTEMLGIGGELEATDTEGNTIYIPNNMQAADGYFADATRGPKYVRTVLVGVVDGTLKIGVKQPTYGSGYWFEMDNWKLEYYGNKAEAYQMWLEDALKNAPKFPEDAVVTNGLIDEYEATVAGLTGSNYEEVSAAIATMYAAAAAVEENIAAWAEWQACVNKGLQFALEGYVGEPVDLLNDYAEFDAEDILDAMELTAEELKAEIEKLNALIDEAIQCVTPGTDVTDKYITNYDFEDTADGKSDGKGWEGSWTAFGGPSNNHNMEAYARDWDTYQIVKGAPEGLYEVSLQGFFRTKRGQEALDLHNADQHTIPGNVYINNNESSLKCIFDEAVHKAENIYSGSSSGGEGDYMMFENLEVLGDTLCYPNTMTSAGEAFSAGMYKSTASGIVAHTGEEFRIGVKGKYVADTWAIWDNFRIVYWGKQADKLLPHLEVAIAHGKENLQKTITKDVRELVEAAIAAAEAAAATSDGDAMFEAMINIYASNDSVNAVADVLGDLLVAAEDVYTAAAVSEAAADVINGAMDYATVIIEAITAGEVTAEQAVAYKKEIDLWLVKLALPANILDATDENPVDVTSLIKNADFGDANGVNSAEGWIGASGKVGDDDTQKSAFAYEYWQASFDMYQTIVGLPNGTYRIEVEASSRVGSIEEDFNAWKTNPDTVHVNSSVMYAFSTDSASYRSKAIKLASVGATAEDVSGRGADQYTDASGNIWYYPNSLASSKDWLVITEAYKNTIHVNVTDETLTLGIKKETATGWIVMDDWKLYYLGGESAQGVVNIQNAGATVSSVSIFTVNGAQVNKLQKGVNILKQTMTDGTVKTIKVIR